MIDTEYLNRLTAEIMEQGYDEAAASELAVRIGDRPMKDLEGNIVVMKGDKVIAVLKPLKMFQNAD